MHRWEIRSLMFQRWYKKITLKCNAKNEMIIEDWMYNGSFWKYNVVIVSFFQTKMHEKKLKWDDFWKFNVKWKFLKIKYFYWKFFQSKMYRWEMRSLMFQWCYIKKKLKYDDKMGWFLKTEWKMEVFFIVECLNWKFFQSKIHRWEKKQFYVSMMLHKEKVKVQC